MCAVGGPTGEGPAVNKGGASWRCYPDKPSIIRLAVASLVVQVRSDVLNKTCLHVVCVVCVGREQWDGIKVPWAQGIHGTYVPPPPCISYALVQATVDVGTILIWDLILIWYQT